MTKEEAVQMVEPRHLAQLLHPRFEETEGAKYKAAKIGKGLPASPGAAIGRIVFTADEAEKWKSEGEKVRRAGPRLGALGWPWLRLPGGLVRCT